MAIDINKGIELFEALKIVKENKHLSIIKRDYAEAANYRDMELNIIEELREILDR